MKKIFTLMMIVALSLTSYVYAQDQPDPKEQEKIQALEIAFISRIAPSAVAQSEALTRVINGSAGVDMLESL